MTSPMNVKGAVAVAIAKNFAMGVPAIRNARTKAGRTAATAPNAQALPTYAYDLMDKVIRYLGPVEGKSILEIGPGDNIVAGLAFLAAGARSYAALDRFPGPYGDETAKQWYRLLREDWSNRYPDRAWPEDLDATTFPNDSRVTEITQGVESAKLPAEYDIVCSYVVGEHVQSIDAFAATTKQAIGANGSAMHAIDFGGHEWNAFGDPFLFLKFPETVWNLMASNRGLPNRVRFNEYRDCFERHGLKVEIVERKMIDYDPTDKWVRERATEDFLTHWAIFKLTA